MPAPDASAPARYRRIHALIREGLVESAHDLSEGGLAVTLAEMAIGGRLGIEATLDDPDECSALFSESLGRLVLEVRAENIPRILESLGAEAKVIGQVVKDYHLHLGAHIWTGADLERAWRGAAS